MTRSLRRENYVFGLSPSSSLDVRPSVLSLLPTWGTNGGRGSVMLDVGKEAECYHSHHYSPMLCGNSSDPAYGVARSQYQGTSLVRTADRREEDLRINPRLGFSPVCPLSVRTAIIS